MSENRLQFSLRGLLALTTVVAVLVATAARAPIIVFLVALVAMLGVVVFDCFRLRPIYRALIFLALILAFCWALLPEIQ